MIRRHLLALLERLCPSIPPNLLDECEWDDIGDDPVIPAQRDPFEWVPLDSLGDDPSLDNRERMVMACGRMEIAAYVDRVAARWAEEQDR